MAYALRKRIALSSEPASAEDGCGRMAVNQQLALPERQPAVDHLDDRDTFGDTPFDGR
ncbi:hypothetical protein [Rhizobium etli]|uniref:Uncharacterized protein n=1 Tax=Rhizobium etli TaxID=29449 RepID=A0A7W6ZCT6_RHIET|nr:hypothetical protein [Rhizobium etli]MBB4477892.1 hypothetical protein [Rhizobium etli]MBB4533724.1 hypothetical protein [Rhizobium etli]